MCRPIKLALIWALLLSVVAPILGTAITIWTGNESAIESCWVPQIVIEGIYIRTLSHFRPIGPLEFDTVPEPVGFFGIIIIYFAAFFFFFRWRARRVADAFN